MKDEARIEITKKSLWPVIFNMQQKEYFPLRMSPVQLLQFAITSKQFVPHFSHISSSGPNGMPVEKAASYWKCYTTPAEVTREDVYNVRVVSFPPAVAVPAFVFQSFL